MANADPVLAVVFKRQSGLWPLRIVCLGGLELESGANRARQQEFKTHMKLHSILFIALIVVGGLSASDRARNTIVLDEQGVRNLHIELATAEYREFDETIFAIGRIMDIPANRVVLSTRIAGRVVELDAFEGDQVVGGQRIAVIESRQLGDPPPRVELFAPRSGLIIRSHIQLGQPVEPSAEIMDIVDRSKVWAVARIPEQEAAQVRVGSRAWIRVPALGTGQMETEVIRFGTEADPDSGTVAAIFELPNPDGRMQPGMRAEFSVVLDSQADVLSVPREAVQGDPARRVVFVEDPSLPYAFVRTPVVIGRQNERYVEILDGLREGDVVVTRGSYGLSFAGPGTGPSLKEALDAAHGHAHNEDGSEIGDDDHDHSGHSHDHGDEDHDHGDECDHDHDGDAGGHMLVPLLIAYSAVVTVALLVVAQMLLNRWRRSGDDDGSEEADGDA